MRDHRLSPITHHVSRITSPGDWTMNEDLRSRLTTLDERIEEIQVRL
jgi:hypothetical protein